MAPIKMTSTVSLAASRQQAQQWSLILEAAGIPCVLEFENSSWVVKVSPVHEKEALKEISAYMEESANWPPDRPKRKVPIPVLTKDQPPTIMMMAALVILYLLSGPWSGGSHWFREGAVSGSQILEHGQWWRLVTGLTLHADIVHLCSNMLFGGVLIHLLCRLLGHGLGWFLILLSGVVGNFLNILIHGPPHNSVGFSTAIFGTIGILAGYQAIRNKTNALREILLPLAAGAALLAFLGVGGPRSDLGAHLFGLLTGGVLGALLVFLPPQSVLVNSKSLQTSLFVVSLAVVSFSWWLAMA